MAKNEAPADLDTSDCINESELAVRWKVNKRTLQRWRQNGTGPRSFKVNGVVRYQMDAIRRIETGGNEPVDG